MAVEYFNVMSFQLQGVIKSMDGQYDDASIYKDLLAVGEHIKMKTSGKRVTKILNYFVISWNIQGKPLWFCGYLSIFAPRILKPVYQ